MTPNAETRTLCQRCGRWSDDGSDMAPIENPQPWEAGGWACKSRRACDRHRRWQERGNRDSTRYRQAEL